MKENSIIDKNNQIILEVALSINKELFDEEKILYKTFKNVEKEILKKIKK